MADGSKVWVKTFPTQVSIFMKHIEQQRKKKRRKKRQNEKKREKGSQKRDEGQEGKLEG